MKHFSFLFLLGAACAGAFLFAFVTVSPRTAKALLNECEPVTLKDECLGYKAGTVVGMLCTPRIGDRRPTFHYVPGMLRPVDEMCALNGPAIPGRKLATLQTRQP